MSTDVCNAGRFGMRLKGKAERRVERSISGGDRVGEEVGGEGKKGESQNLKEQLVKAELFF